ncbi:CehA/McbA family metallohydrolase [Janthinobacterium agaricidamnosum]|uniref:Phosphotransferase n=1 Tax=Janthinobacterium agaricidamnosum NBRC 102515 = DSM 9628 TaxID=1349767 RepID=W0V118_9BURK|nr:CehA/McbA family metallohydrolase [Janthinobacterium agaricidamnosum]CDG82514.1 hypothetical protein GJA_1878 [Janthinobacterium agaricidamnosum NBRC 102515 = DSM 9628]
MLNRLKYHTVKIAAFGLLACCALPAPAALAAAPHEHREFEATLQAPYRAPGDNRARTISLQFAYPMADQPQRVSWRLDLLDPDGAAVRSWFGDQALLERPVDIALRWDGRADGKTLPGGLSAGIYQLRLRALARDAGAALAGASLNGVEEILSSNAQDSIEQRWTISVGQLAPLAMPGFQALAGPSLQWAPAAGALPYTVVYANLHSQTNHSDGGGPLAGCHGAQAPQSAPFGPKDAYQYALDHGLDSLMTSEHNHMYDGSDRTNRSADPLLVRALYQSGLAAAAEFTAAHPGFVALYGMEWGVIKGGGHLNIFNSNQLLGWEMNDSGQLLADTYTEKGDYAGLYALMAQRGWIGQFNHPALSGQFVVGGLPFGYSQDGDQAMALCEVMNTSAFSVNTTETESRRSNYELACNKALAAGFHVAFSSNQDNHCANWGASYSNRTGILIPNDTPLSRDSLLQAIQARRVFATMDKQSQLVLTANGHIMGERFGNSGPLSLSVGFSNQAGRSASAVTIFQGVPGANGSVTPLSTAATITLTPSDGEHFYYARLTQDDGKVLWSAPVWVTQRTATQQTMTQPTPAHR